MDKPHAEQIVQDIKKALAPLLELHGLSLAHMKPSYDATNVMIKLELAERRPDGNVETREAEAYHQLCEVYGMKPEWLFAEVEAKNGRKYKIIGLNPKSRKYPVIGQREGKTWKLPTTLFGNGGDYGADVHRERA